MTEYVDARDQRDAWMRREDEARTRRQNGQVDPNWPLGPVRSVHDAIRYIITFIGDDPDREDLLETPDRVVRAYAEMFSAYRRDTPSLEWFKSTEIGRAHV